MKILGMRWGYDGGGIACGPVEGNTIVEISVTNEDRHNFFVVVSRMSEFERVFVSPIPLFDLLMSSNHYDVDSEAEFEKVTDNALEDYSYELPEMPEEMNKSEFAKVIHLARLAMEQYYGSDDAASVYETAQAFIKDYIDNDLDEMDLPDIEFESGEDEYEDEDEDES